MHKIGLVGCGFMGGMHGEVYGVLPGVQLALTVDKRIEAAINVAAQHDAKSSLCFDDILADSSIEVVDICLPTHLHADYSIRALESGKHVFCEKPMALTVHEAWRMADAARTAAI